MFKISKDIDGRSDLDKAYEIIKSMLDEAEYKYSMDIIDGKIHLEFQQFIKGQELIKMLGYINRELRFNKLQFLYTRGKYPRVGNKPGREWIEYYEKNNI